MLAGDYFLLDLASGQMRQLTSLRPGYKMNSFDISLDGKTILFDRYREHSDVVQSICRRADAMPLAAGSRLGPYEILSPLGAGGMGEVYRARDTRLGREVAIKVLLTTLASDPERLKRFEREAQSASSLNHPNIVTIYDIGSEDGVSFIAMELVQGKSLRASVDRGALPVRRLLQLGVQIAEGLSKAHAAGIVHRDLKPENVMVTEDDHVKILDFGLAKLTQPEGSSEGETLTPTVSLATREGVIVGTVVYMSPEQATSQPVDYRSDQFALGSILYEMATGRRAFQRESAPQTLTAIIQDEPEPIAALNPNIPAPVRWIVERCLSKRPRNRYASTEDLARELATVRDHLSEATSALGSPPLDSAPIRKGWRIPAAIGAVVLLAVGLAEWRRRQGVDSWTNPFAGARFTRLTDWDGSELDAAISRDGKMVAFNSDRGGQFGVWVGQIGESEYIDLTKDQAIKSYPASGVIRTIAFTGDDHVAMGVTSGGHLGVWLAPALGGAVRPFLADAVEGSWSPDGNQIVYHTLEPGDPTFVVDRRGANPRRIFVDDSVMHDHYPIWSPDGRFIYFVRGIPLRDTDVWRMKADGGVPERMTHHHAGVAYPTLLDNRTLVYVGARQDSGMGLYGMDTERRLEHALTSGLEEYRSVAASADGRRLVTTVANPTRGLWVVPITDRIVDDSVLARFPMLSLRATAPRFGPGFLLHLASRGGADGLWKLKDGVETELWSGRDGAVTAAPAASADGARIAFVVRSEGRSRLYVMQSDGTGARRIDIPSEIRDAPSWSPDGKWIAVVAGDDKSCPLFKVPSDGGPPVRLAEGLNADPVWSPDGRLILYSAAKGGPFLQLRAATPDGQPVRLPDIMVLYTGNRYRFLPDGKSCIVAQGPAIPSLNFWLLDLTTGALRQLTNLRPGDEMKAFDVSPDGKQILFDRYRENSDVVLIDLPPR